MDKLLCQVCGQPIPPSAEHAAVDRRRKYCGLACYNIHRTPAPLADRFWKYVEKSADCWEWTAARNERGYGAFGLDRERMTPAHRFSWQLHFGPIPAGLKVLHACDNPPCVNPDHLMLGTHAANNRDMRQKGRDRSVGKPGESNPNAKLTEADVREIRRLRADGMMPGQIAPLFGVSGVLISYICNGKAWKHVPPPPSRTPT